VSNETFNQVAIQHALELDSVRSLLAAAQATISQLRCTIDRLDCTMREGGQALHCPVDNQCLRCRFNSAQAKIAELEAQHERMKCALRTIYLDDIFDDTMRSIAAEALKNG
jgi:hypothetical protein